MGLPWWGWAIAAAALGWAEIHVPGAYLIWIALGAALTAAAEAAFGLRLEAQLIVLIVASALSCGVGFFVYGRRTRRPDPGARLNSRDRLMVGQAGTVCTALVNGEGKVRVGDTVWLAAGPDLPEGTPVVIRSVRASRLVVERA
ncbi:MAG: NfeD family protein [Proteobacteria bacterium]|nr:NfeD family protein [Pseudomonadota bacterium]